MSFASWAAALLLSAGGQATLAPSPSPPTTPAGLGRAKVEAGSFRSSCQSKYSEEKWGLRGWSV